MTTQSSSTNLASGFVNGYQLERVSEWSDPADWDSVKEQLYGLSPKTKGISASCFTLHPPMLAGSNSIRRSALVVARRKLVY